MIKSYSQRTRKANCCENCLRSRWLSKPNNYQINLCNKVNQITCNNHHLNLKHKNYSRPWIKYDGPESFRLIRLLWFRVMNSIWVMMNRLEICWVVLITLSGSLKVILIIFPDYWPFLICFPFLYWNYWLVFFASILLI